jgi:hypothetical protein
MVVFVVKSILVYLSAFKVEIGAKYSLVGSRFPCWQSISGPFGPKGEQWMCHRRNVELPGNLSTYSHEIEAGEG